MCNVSPDLFVNLGKIMVMCSNLLFYRNLFFGGSNKKKNTQSPSPQPRRRGSASSDQQIPSDTEIGGVSYHSYSTGNLRELDDKPKKAYRYCIAFLSPIPIFFCLHYSKKCFFCTVNYPVYHMMLEADCLFCFVLFLLYV